MENLIYISIAFNLVLILLCLWLVYPKIKQDILKKKKQRETQAKQKNNLEKAHLVKTIRAEVRKYLKELQDQ